MRQILSSFFLSLRTRFLSVWTKVQMLLRPSYWKNTGLVGLRRFFTKLFDVKPKSAKDYYATRRWLISRKLVFATVVGMGLLCLAFLAMSIPVISRTSDAMPQMRTYKYSSLALKFYKGNAKILAKDGHVAYVGMVENGEAKGSGTLLSSDGTVLYEGLFEASMFSGAGVLNYPDGTMQYEGEFVNNHFSGTGTFYRESGVQEYTGNFSQGLKNGHGVLFNSGGNPIFKGSFVNGYLLFDELVGKKTTEVSTFYTGGTATYTMGEEFCVEMPEISSVYSVKSGAQTLERDWVVSRIYVLSNVFPGEDEPIKTVDDLQKLFGTPQYSGNTYLTMAEVVAANKIAKTMQNFGNIEMSLTANFENAFSVNGFNQNYQVYIYTFVRGGLVYTFYCPSAASAFLMYSVEMA